MCSTGLPRIIPAKQISASWGWTGGPTLTTDQIFQQMAAQGQTFFTASGDGDAYPAGTIDSPFGSWHAVRQCLSDFGWRDYADDERQRPPSYGSKPHGTGGPLLASYNWNPDGYFGSSGAISTSVAIKSELADEGINMVTNRGSTTFRNVPDVALTADNVFVISDGGFQGIYGGTSCAAPLWAALMALVNQQAINNNRCSGRPHQSGHLQNRQRLQLYELFS